MDNKFIINSVIKIENTSSSNYPNDDNILTEEIYHDIPEFVDVNNIGEIKTGDIEQTFKCNTCGNKYDVLKCLKLHEFLHNPVNRCPSCRKEFMYRREFAAHINAHIRDITKTIRQEELCCKICKKKFNTRRNLMDHSGVHTKNRIHKCNLCDKRYRQKSALYKHLKDIHINGKSYNCKICNESVPYVSSLRNHMKETHPEFYEERKKSIKDRTDGTRLSVKKNFKCILCSEKSLNRKLYLEHRRDHLQYSEAEIQKAFESNLFTCKLCQSDFIGCKNLFLHMNIHMDKTYKCNICKQLFSYYSYVKHVQNIRCDN